MSENMEHSKLTILYLKPLLKSSSLKSSLYSKLTILYLKLSFVPVGKKIPKLF